VFGRTPKLPADLRPDLERDERVIAWARAGDAAIVVTNRGLWWPGRPERIWWHEIHKATWADGRLTVTGAVPVPAAPAAGPVDEPRPDVAEHSGYVLVEDAPPISVMLTEPGAVPRRLRERVNASVAYTTLYPVPGGGARVVGRRVSGRDGLRWSVRFEGAVQSDDPAVRAAVDQFVSESKASIAVVE